MHIILEYACCILVAAIFASLFLTACVTVFAFKAGCRLLAQTSRKLMLEATSLRVRWMAAATRDA